MRVMNILSLVLFALMVHPTVSLGQVESQVCDYTLRVESADNPAANVPFTGAYFFGDSLKDHLLTTVVRETPFILEFSAQQFLGMFQGKEGKNNIKVSLNSRANGKPGARVEGQGPVNILLADGGRVSWGFPSRSRNPRPR